MIISVMHTVRKSKSSSFPGRCIIMYLHVQESQKANIIMQAVAKLQKFSRRYWDGLTQWILQ